jgi:hypothetical protein
MNFGMQNGITACSGAELNILPDGTFGIRMVELSLQNKLIHIVSKKEYTATLDNIKITGAQGPVALTLSGKGVLIKKTSRLETVTEQSLRHLFPSFKQEEFYLQHFCSADHSFIAFVRKEIADRVIAAFRKQGAQVLLLSLGPFVADHVIPQLNHYGGSLNFDGHQLTLNEEKAWLDYTYEPGSVSGFALKIDIEPIPEQFLLAYASAFQLLLNDRLELVAIESEELKQGLIELTAELKFKKRGTLILFFFFAVLLLNFLLFSFYNAANQELAGKAGQRSDLFTDRQKLEAEVKEKEAQVKRIGWNHGLRYAYLCDQIGQSIPAALNLTELSMGAIKEGPGSSQKSKGTGRMKITGQSASVYIIHDWIYTLKQKHWVKAVQLEKYATDEQKGAQVFTLLVDY